MLDFQSSKLSFVTDFSVPSQQKSSWTFDDATGKKQVELKFDYYPIASTCSITCSREFIEDFEYLLKTSNFKLEMTVEILERKSSLLQNMLDIANKKAADLEATNTRLKRRLNRYTGK